MILFNCWILPLECSAMENITFEEAQKTAQRKLDLTNPEHHFTLAPGRVQEFAFGWVFGFAPKKYLETHNINDMVPGPGSLVVERDGSTQFLPSSASPDLVLAEFLRQRKARHH
jgi:hypothetical protein